MLVFYKKSSQVVNFEGRTLRFFAFGSLLVLSQYLIHFRKKKKKNDILKSPRRLSTQFSN